MPLEADGLAVAGEAGWWLNDEAERAYGRALRLFQERLDDVEAEVA